MGVNNPGYGTGPQKRPLPDAPVASETQGEVYEYIDDAAFTATSVSNPYYDNEMPTRRHATTTSNTDTQADDNMNEYIEPYAETVTTPPGGGDPKEYERLSQAHSAPPVQETEYDYIQLVST